MALLAFDVLMAGVGVTAALGIFIWVQWRSRLTPQQRALRREFRRRQAISREGRIIEATVTDIQDDAIYYAYQLQGVAYSTSQDVSVFADSLPVAREKLVGPAACKYIVNNPANSLVICEEWSGLKKIKKESHEEIAH